MIKKYKTREITECTFTPKINRSYNNSNSDNDPAYLKLFEYSKDRETRKRLKSHEKQIEFDKVYTFSPTTNSEVNSKLADENFVDRMKKYDSSLIRYKIKKNEKIKKIKSEIDQQLPKPIKRSNSLSKLNIDSSLLCGDRIYELQKKKIDKIRKIESEMMNVNSN